MIYKIIGETSNGRCSCGHRVKAREEYYIFTNTRKFSSICKKCSGKVNRCAIIRVPEDLDHGAIRLQ